MKLNQLIGILEPREIFGNAQIEITGIAYDSRKVMPGYLFVCVEGMVTDGHNFINDAISRGAAALIISKKEMRPAEFGGSVFLVEDSRRALSKAAAEFYDNPSKKLKLIGITGTNGKTTTAYLISSILRTAGKMAGMLGTIEYQIGDRKIAASRTTPESLELQEYFAEMVKQGCTYAVMEVSSHSLEMGRVEDCHFSGAVFTNLTPEHLDFHDNMENYFSSKHKLFLKVDRFGAAVTNLDDEYGKRMILGCRSRVLTYGHTQDADVSLLEFESDNNGIRAELLVHGKAQEVQSLLLGDYNLDNIMAAAAFGLSQGLDWPVIAKGISKLPSVPGRFEPIRCGQTFTVIVDYAHTEDALRNLLKSARKQTKGRIITVFGCGGDRDKTKRPMMGATAYELSDFVVVTSDNPRSEEPMVIIKEVESGILRAAKGRRGKYQLCVDRKQAIEVAISLAKGQDMVVIAGKGHENYQIIGNKTFPFDDREVASQIMSKLFKRYF